MIKCNIKGQLVGSDFESRPHLAMILRSKGAQRENSLWNPVPVPFCRKQALAPPEALSPGIAGATQIGLVSLDSPVTNRLVESYCHIFPAECIAATFCSLVCSKTHGNIQY